MTFFDCVVISVLLFILMVSVILYCGFDYLLVWVAAFGVCVVGWFLFTFVCGLLMVVLV